MSHEIHCSRNVNKKQVAEHAQANDLSFMIIYAIGQLMPTGELLNLS